MKGEWQKIAKKRKSRRKPKVISELIVDDGDDDIQIGELKTEDAGEWVEFSAVVDSGAEVHALSEQIAEWIPITPSYYSRNGKSFRAANHTKIPAKGKRRTVGMTNARPWRAIEWEVCPVKRPLLSVTRLAKAGNQVHIADNTAWILNTKTREKTYLRRERGVWMLDFWIKRPPKSKEGFPGPGP